MEAGEGQEVTKGLRITGSFPEKELEKTFTIK